MSEIRDKVIDEIAKSLSCYPDLWDELTEEQKDYWRTYAKDKILSNKHIAIVNREAKLPEVRLPSSPETANTLLLAYDKNVGYHQAQIDMLRADYVKEIAPKGG